MRLRILVIGNLLAGLLQQALVLALVGGPDADVLFSAQAPFVVIAAVATSIAINVGIPWLGAADGRLAAFSRPFLGWATVATAGVAALFLVLGHAVLADRIVANASFGAVLLVCAATCIASISLAVLTADLSVRRKLDRAECVQLACSLVALLSTSPLVGGAGLVGAALALALRPLLALSVCAVLAWPRLMAAPGSDLRMQASSLLRQVCLLVASHGIQKCGPLIDRTILGYADAAWLALYAIASQSVGALLSYVERTETRRRLLALADAAHAGRSPAGVDGPVRPGRIGALLAAALPSALVLWVWLSPFLPQPWLTAASRFAILVPFSAACVVAGAWSQWAAAPLYAANRIEAIARLSTASAVISFALRWAFFAVVGLPGLLAGVLSHYVIGARLFRRVARTLNQG